MFAGIRILWRLLEGFRVRYALAVTALAMATLFAYLGPLVTRATIDSIIATGGEAGAENATSSAASWLGLDRAELSSRLWLAAALLGGLAVGTGLFTYFKGRLTAQASEGVIRRLRERLYDHLQHLPCRYFDTAETGDLVQRATSDVETVRHFLSLQLIEVGRASLLIVTVIPIMLLLHAPMAAVSLAGAPLVLGFGVLFFLRIRPAFLEMDEAEGRMTTVLQENLTGIRVVRAFARQQHECDKFIEASRSYRDRNYRLIRLMAAYWPISDIMVLSQQMAVLLCGAYWVSQGQLSVGTLVAFLLFVNLYVWPMRQMGRILADLGKALVALGRIEEILAAPRESDVSSDDVEAATIPFAGRIEFNHVSFSYRDANLVLEDVSFTVEAGQTLAIAGPSGAGKSTLVSLLLRLYDDYQGSIRIDGRELRNIDRKVIRAAISVVMQEPFLFSKTLKENISLGRHDAAEQELLEAATIAEIHESISRFEHGYETLVGERGVTLSGGQRQRVALARALLQRPAILILDDALSAVDTQTETLILEALRSRHGRHTTLIVAHRLSTLRHADQVLVLDGGRVSALGTHRKLESDSPTYRRLWEIEGGWQTELESQLEAGGPT